MAKRLKPCQPPRVVEAMYATHVPPTHEAVAQALRAYFGRDLSRSDIETYTKELAVLVAAK